MNALSRLVRQTLVMVAVLAALLLGFSVYKAVSDGRTLNAVVALTFLAVIAGGLLPGSYIHRLANSLGRRATREQGSKLVVLAIVGPLLLTVLLAIGVLNALDSLRFIQQNETGTFDAALPRFDLVRFGTLGFVSAVWLFWNVITLIRGRSESEPERSPK